MVIYGDVCSGISAPTVAWKPLGWRCAFYSEIEKAPRAVLKHHYPDTPLHGDFTTIRAGDYEAIDLLVGGTPCQDFSVAGLRRGLAGERGNLTLEFVQLAERLQPTWLVYENVPGILSQDEGRAFGAFLWLLGECGYGFAYRVLDAQYAGVAQRRERLFLVGHLGDWRRPAAVLFDAASLRWDSPPSREKGQATASTIRASLGRRNGQADGQCERLMAFPDDYTLVPYRNGMMKDGPRYKMLGNSMVVNELRWIGERIAFLAQKGAAA